jgi:hypothetical protein
MIDKCGGENIIIIMLDIIAEEENKAALISNYDKPRRHNSI